jgi:hypothetical protein
MNKILEANADDRFVIHCPESGADGPWSFPQVVQLLALVHHEGWCDHVHTVELIEVTN